MKPNEHSRPRKEDGKLLSPRIEWIMKENSYYHRDNYEKFKFRKEGVEIWKSNKKMIFIPKSRIDGIGYYYEEELEDHL